MKQLWGRIRAAFSMPALAMLVLVCALLIIGTSLKQENTGQTTLEQRISSALSGVEGAGKVEVVIRTRTVALQTAGAFASSAQQSEEIPCGAVAVAEGADDPLVKIRLTQALCALLNLQASEVDVICVSGG